VVIEATGNAAAVAEVLRPHVGRVVIANPQQVRLIAHAKIKTDRVDASVLARLYASGFLPEVWVPDEQTQALRRQVTRRNQLVRQRTRLKNIVQSILHSHLVPPCPTANLFVQRAAHGSRRKSSLQTSATRSGDTCGNTSGSEKIWAWSSGTWRGAPWRTSMRSGS
jgi:transposase